MRLLRDNACLPAEIALVMLGALAGVERRGHGQRRPKEEEAIGGKMRKEEGKKEEEA